MREWHGELSHLTPIHNRNQIVIIPRRKGEWKTGTTAISNQNHCRIKSWREPNSSAPSSKRRMTAIVTRRRFVPFRQLMLSPHKSESDVTFVGKHMVEIRTRRLYTRAHVEVDPSAESDMKANAELASVLEESRQTARSPTSTLARQLAGAQQGDRRRHDELVRSCLRRTRLPCWGGIRHV